MERCSNCIYRVYPKIPPSPIKEASLAIVGEAPGTAEVANRQPFVGLSSKLIKQTLEIFGFSMEEAFITNAILCRPVDTPPKFECVHRCRDRLINELLQVRPRLVLALGGIALNSLMGSTTFKITQEQGRVYKSEDLPDMTIISCLHPAKVLRTPGDYHNFHRVVGRAIHILNTGKLPKPVEPRFVIVDTPELMQMSYNYIKTREVVIGDIETTGLSYMDDKIIDLGVAVTPEHVYIYPQHMLAQTKALFELPTKWCWHGGFFDTAFLRRNGLPAKLDHDTMKLHYCLNENGPHDLEFLAGVYLGAPNYKGVVDKYKSAKDGYEKVPKHILYPYLAKDVSYTYQLFDMWYPIVQASEDLSWLYHHHLLPGTEFLRRLSRNGMRVNEDAVIRLHEELMLERQAKEEEIRYMVRDIWDPNQYAQETGAKKVPKEFNPGSTQQLAWLLYDKLKIRPPKRTRSTNKDILKLIHDKHPIIPEVEKLRSIKKRDGTYAIGLLKRIASDGRVHSRFSMTRTRTGRTSSSDPNVQNIDNDPRVRGVYEAPPGKVYLQADYKAAELRVLAHISGDEVMNQVFLDKRDLHVELATELYGPNFTKKEKLRAKAVNFGVPYGRSEFSIAEEHNMPRQEARAMIENWKRRYAQAHAYLLSCDRAVERGEVLETPFKRRRRYGLITPLTLEEVQHEARNFRIQSIASDLTLISGMRVEPKVKPLGALICNFVHDSLLMEVPDDPTTIREIAKIVSTEMSQVPIDTLGATVPFVAEIEVGKRWNELRKYHWETDTYEEE